LESKILKEMLEELVRQNARPVRHTSKKQKSHNAERLSSKQVLSYSSIIWQDKQVTAKLIAAEASQIIQTVNKRRPTFFSGKSEKGLLSGMFYLLSLKNKAMKTQREIARSLNTTDVTVRASYRKWLKEFSDLFSDVPAKLAEDEKIGLSVPSNHGKEDHH
jgi:transcription initiation factor TFIIIB Brf1 subunit/transcription initiation factor TFIIB